LRKGGGKFPREKRKIITTVRKPVLRCFGGTKERRDPRYLGEEKRTVGLVRGEDSIQIPLFEPFALGEAVVSGGTVMSMHRGRGGEKGKGGRP